MEELQTWILAQQTIDKGFLLSEKSEFKSKKKKKKGQMRRAKIS